MGCDIHVHIEVKINNNWEHYSAPVIRRWYALFTYMADVRNYDPLAKPIAAPRGLPDDLSIVTKLDHGTSSSDWHSESWLDSKEIGLVMNFVSENETSAWKGQIEHEEWGYLFGNGIGSFHEYKEDYPDKIEDVRLVFWFDN